ncbi:MAG: hypothetical protein JW869_04285 [Candidatus Omnitrophica bacterium]|nr:hypothetical protein [Candidatus Omnitrophota bacterium]
MRNFLLLFLLLISVSICGCGYTTGSLLPSDLQTIYIGPFRNKIQLTEELAHDAYRFRTYRAQLEVDITRAVIERFINDGHLKVVEQENADLVLSGDLIDYLRQPLRYGADNETVEEYRVSVVCAVILEDKKHNKIMWEDPRVIGDSSYNLEGTYAGSEDSAVSIAITDLARRIVNHTIEGW